MQKNLPELREIPLAEVSSFKSPPSLKIRTDDDVEYWKTTQPYLDYGIFLRRLNESVVGFALPWEPENQSPVSYLRSNTVHRYSIRNHYIVDNKNSGTS